MSSSSIPTHRKVSTTVVGNWFIHKRHTDSTPFFEVTGDKKVVWQVDMHERIFDPASIQILDVKGYPLR